MPINEIERFEEESGVRLTQPQPESFKHQTLEMEVDDDAPRQ